MNQPVPDNYIQVTLFGDTHVRIQRINNDTSWNEPVHAINWFDTRQLQLYNFYNLLASRSVKKVGGKPVFKGRLISRQHGSDDDERQVLLLVKYPTPDQFKSMVGNTYFKFVSLLRALAVKHFTFCLSHSVAAVNISEKRTPDDQYAIHHFRGDMSTLELIRAALEKNSIEVAFSSLKTHQLYSVSGKKEPSPVPAIMDGIVLFKCNDETTLNEIVNSEHYQQSLQQSQSSYIGLYKRIL